MWDEATEDASEDESGWYYIGHGNINHAANRIQLPDGIFEAGILERNGEAFWSYERAVGTLIVSNDELTEEETYNCVGSRQIGPSGDNHRAGVPAEFFDYYGGETGKDAQKVPEKAQIRRGQERHFVYREGMASGQPRSCYLLTGEQVANRLKGSDDWAGNYDSIPKFF